MLMVRIRTGDSVPVSAMELARVALFAPIILLPFGLLLRLLGRDARNDREEADFAADTWVLARTTRPRRKRSAARSFFTPGEVERWPANVVALAEAMAAGQDCWYALHDALLEAGHPDLAEHFRTPGHLDGCPVLERILRGRAGEAGP